MSLTAQGPDWWQAPDGKWYAPPSPPALDDTAVARAAPEGPSTGSGAALPPEPPTYATIEVPSSSADGQAGGPTSLAAPTAGVPPAPPAPPGSTRTDTRIPLLVTLAFVVVVALLAVLVAVLGDDDEEPAAARSTTTTSPLATTDRPATTEPTAETTTGDTGPPASGPDDTSTTGPPGGGTGGVSDIEILEQGFSAAPDDTLTFGALVRNNADQVAIICGILIEAFDAAGESVASYDSLWHTAVLPGQTVGISRAGIALGGDPVELDVGVENIHWDDPANHGETTASGVETTVDAAGFATTSFTASSTYTDDLPAPFAWVVYRNAAGEIVGGDTDPLSGPLSPGEATDDEVRTDGPVPDIDEAQTEVWIEPGQEGASERCSVTGGGSTPDV